MAQSSTPGTWLAFDVASIRPSDPADPNSFTRMDPGGKYRAQGITVTNLIANAYGHKLFEVSGGPDWVRTARYDIIAKAEESSDEDPHLSASQRQEIYGRQRQRLQSLLEDRFQLKFHKIKKDLPVYALVIGKSGPKMKIAEDAGGQMSSLRVGPGMFIGHGISASQLANHLGNFVNREVIDKTGLTELYDIKLECTPEWAQMTAGAPGSDASAPSIFVALQEQLGLKLESQKAQGEVLIIDRVERPSEN